MMPLNDLQQARALELPSRDAMLHRAPSVQQFWDNHQDLLANAWTAWENTDSQHLKPLDDSLLDADLRDKVSRAWEHPTAENERAVQNLWHEVIPGVYQCQFFDPERLKDLRHYLDQAAEAQIPLRPPYGIVLNRSGAMLDKRSPGFLAAPSFQALYQDIMDTYMRPIARLLFPEIIGYDTQTFGFSIQYQPSTDTSIRPHTDASSVTLNINLNLPDEAFSGSSVDFFDAVTGQSHAMTFTPGTAVIHRGHVPHAAQPITQGERSNIVLWLYGDRGQIPAKHNDKVNMDARQRWSTPASASDKFAPF